MKKLWLFILVSGLSVNAAIADVAGLFFEPMITYEQGDSKINYPEPMDDSSGKIRGFGTGARLGVHIFDSLFIGVDGRYSWVKFEDSSFDQNTDAKSWNYGPVLGVQMPTIIGLRVWAGYILDGEVDPKKDNGYDAKYTDGKGYRVGAGVNVGSVSLNLEYQHIRYDDTQVESNDYLIPTGTYGDAELENKAYVLSVSFPMEF